MLANLLILVRIADPVRIADFNNPGQNLHSRRNCDTRPSFVCSSVSLYNVYGVGIPTIVGLDFGEQSDWQDLTKSVC